MKNILFALAIIFSVNINARTITDDHGRVVEVPEHITKIYAASPPLTMSLLAFNPDLVAGLNSPFNEMQKKYVASAYNKPVVGGFMGQGNIPNFEILAGIKPDVIIMWTRMRGYEKILTKFEKMGIPVLLVNNESIYDLITQFELFAKLTGDTTRADELIAYTKKSLSLIESLKKELSKQKEVRYYFAQGLDGLSSECEGSFHLEPFKYAGAKNALDCRMSSNYGMEKISMESVILSNPDVIVAMERTFTDTLMQNPQWRNLRAVKEGKVFTVPTTPFNYISRPPSFMRLLGIRWLIDSFYPSLLEKPFEEEKKEFEKLFFPQLKEN
ncbi:MAG: ABC transporter substrate-binding protein [Sulfurimonas sp. RIFOXYB2_FULL_37_5]|uniref:ABC transporter substrate-binding protein n=2 Tax=Sulfurimonas TaxID=202746 RepID=UPI0008B6CC42|nr:MULTISPECIES: ABC transporter substrate-binding protein [unclassified Sulfurimonas]MBS4069558.1 ABC transporter substrate-binding protein [Sulfurimonas sp.]MDD3855470.1 ABC transporter substrate-binding protein [Sulfurimonas sp.]OHE03524.1 MAG: ABC transporter substrate-binding protein [Sulfurimonas sp. RIFOXYB12_FULL_35_9]OHE15362.1 MAG: ABC transporter substrate-binding protein [Sulfurimonas sp. RIFOXYB2_FULL_37_5]